MWGRLAEWLALTKTEQNVILFLVVMMVAGLAIREYEERVAGAIRFDYRASDSTFAALSAAAIADSSSDESTDSDEAISVNEATKEELMQIPGIGSSTAERIIAFRSTVGRITSLEQLTSVKGMSRNRLKKIRGFLKLP